MGLKTQCFRSGLDPDSIRSVDPDPESGSGFRSAEMTHKNRKILWNFMFWTAGCSLLREIFFSSVNLSQFLVIRSAFSLKCWIRIRIRIKWIPYGSETLWKPYASYIIIMCVKTSYQLPAMYVKNSLYVCYNASQRKRPKCLPEK